jgi:hypothetical protein
MGAIIGKTYFGTNVVFGLGNPGPSVDPDAQAFITAAGISGSDATAINTLVVDLKADNIWNELQAIYPFVGGTSDSMKWNLKDPQDTNAAYRMQFTGSGWTFSSNGVQQSNNATTFGNTNYAANTNDNTVGMSMGVYINGGTNAQGYDLASITFTPSTAEAALIAGFGNNIFYVAYGPLVTTSAFTMPNGFFVANSDGTDTKGYRNGTEVSTAAQVRNLNIVNAINLGNRVGGIGDSATDRRYAFCFIGKSLDATDQANLYTAVQTFQTTLGRQI